MELKTRQKIQEYITLNALKCVQIKRYKSTTPTLVCVMNGNVFYFDRECTYLWCGSSISANQTEVEFLNQVCEHLAEGWQEVSEVTPENFSEYTEEQPESIKAIGTLQGNPVFKGMRTGKVFAHNGNEVAKKDLPLIKVDFDSDFFQN